MATDIRKAPTITPPRSRSFALLVVLLLAAAPAFAQSAQPTQRFDEVRTNSGSYFFHVKPGEATMKVQVLGAVRAPGLYELGRGTSVSTLLALSGGPLLDVRQRNNKRTVTLRLWRSGHTQPYYETILEQAVARPETSPAMQEGDVLMVEIEEKQKFGWRDAFTIVGGVGALAFAIESIVTISK